MEQPLDVRWNSGLIGKLRVDLTKAGKTNTEEVLANMGSIINQ